MENQIEEQEIYEFEFEGLIVDLKLPTFDEFYNSFKSSFFSNHFDTDKFHELIFKYILVEPTKEILENEELRYYACEVYQPVIMKKYYLPISEKIDDDDHIVYEYEGKIIALNKPDFQTIKLFRNNMTGDLIEAVKLISFKNIVHHKTNTEALKDPNFMFIVNLSYIGHIQFKTVNIKKKSMTTTNPTISK